MRTSPTPASPSSVTTLTIDRLRQGVPSTNVWTSEIRTHVFYPGLRRACGRRKVASASMQAVSNVAPPIELERSRVVGIMRRTDPTLACETVEALLDGGMCAVEVTFNSPGALEMLRAIERAFGSRVLLGAGTVLDRQQADVPLDPCAGH